MLILVVGAIGFAIAAADNCNNGILAGDRGVHAAGAGDRGVHVAPVNGTTIGAEVTLGQALDPSALPAEVLAKVKLQLVQTPVLIFRGLGEKLSMGGHVRFARQFGTVDPAVSRPPPCEYTTYLMLRRYCAAAALRAIPPYLLLEVNAALL